MLLFPRYALSAALVRVHILTVGKGIMTEGPSPPPQTRAVEQAPVPVASWTGCTVLSPFATSPPAVPHPLSP